MHIHLTENIHRFKQQALLWADQFPTLCYLDSNDYGEDKYSACECLLAAGSVAELRADSFAFEQLQKFAAKHNDWLFGGLTYDLKNELERLQSQHDDGVNWPGLHFFVPRHLILIHKDGRIEIESKTDDPQQIFEAINTITLPALTSQPVLQVEHKISKAAYLENYRVHPPAYCGKAIFTK